MKSAEDKSHPPIQVKQSKHYPIRKWSGIAAVLGGIMLFMAPAFWRLHDPYRDAQRIAVTCGVVLVVFGLIGALTVPKPSRAGMSNQQSGLMLLLLGVLLLVGSLPFFSVKGLIFLGASGFLTALMMIGVGIFRSLRRD
jgi:hypothetical protein